MEGNTALFHWWNNEEIYLILLSSSLCTTDPFQVYGLVNLIYLAPRLHLPNNVNPMTNTQLFI